MKGITKVYTVEEIIDMGSHVVAVFLTEERANAAAEELDNERIEMLERNAKVAGQAVPAWMYVSKYEVCEYEVED